MLLSLLLVQKKNVIQEKTGERKILRPVQSSRKRVCTNFSTLNLRLNYQLSGKRRKTAADCHLLYYYV